MVLKIVIAGAGDMGYHLAQRLSYENKDIVLIDLDKELLDNIASNLDVMTIMGDSASLEVLKNANVQDANIVMAVTTSEDTNLLTAMLAKQLGAKKVIARVRNHEYSEPKNKIFFQKLGVDHLISPSILCSEEIFRMVENSTFSDIFEFGEGKLNVVGITLDRDSTLINKKLSETRSNPLIKDIRIIAIVRDQLTIIPKGDTVIRTNDHVYFISHKKEMSSIIQLVGQKKVVVKNIMLIGGDDLAYTTALKLEMEYHVTLIHRDKERCKWLAGNLRKALVIHGDYKNIDLLLDEGLEEMEAFLALTESSETNIITSLSAKNHGVYKTIAHVDTREYIHISHSIGVDSLINKKLVAANQITRYFRKGHVESVSNIYGVDAEFIEYEITKNNKLTRKPLKEMHFPATALVAGVIRGEKTFIPDGDFTLQINDKAIVFALPSAKISLENLFK
jgi:trk system potassium uptake protein TrkA